MSSTKDRSNTEDKFQTVGFNMIFVWQKLCATVNKKRASGNTGPVLVDTGVSLSDQTLCTIYTVPWGWLISCHGRKWEGVWGSKCKGGWWCHRGKIKRELLKSQKSDWAETHYAACTQWKQRKKTAWVFPQTNTIKLPTFFFFFQPVPLLWLFLAMLQVGQTHVVLLC